MVKLNLEPFLLKNICDLISGLFLNATKKTIDTKCKNGSGKIGVQEERPKAGKPRYVLRIDMRFSLDLTVIG